MESNDSAVVVVEPPPGVARLPLVCDSNIASIAHPNVSLPPRFRYPDDARRQLAMAREYIAANFGVAPVGLWPSEGSVSDEVFHIASEVGFKWAATDSGVLNRTLNRAVPVEGLYRPYEWVQGEHRMQVIFRDHFMSDLIGFVYSKMGAGEAAGDFLHRIRGNCEGILRAGRWFFSVAGMGPVAWLMAALFLPSAFCLLPWTRRSSHQPANPHRRPARRRGPR